MSELKKTAYTSSLKDIYFLQTKPYFVQNNIYLSDIYEATTIHLRHNIN